jgi:hypothetical protein
MHLLQRGKNAGQPCGKKSCRKHHQDTLLPSRQWGVYTCVVDTIVQGCHNDPRRALEKLVAMEQANRDLRELVHSRAYPAMYSKLFGARHTYEAIMDRVNLTTKGKLRLLLECGCQRCGMTRVKSVHWPFPIRLCPSCLSEVLITKRDIKREYNYDYDGDVLLRKGSDNVYWRHLVEIDLGHPLHDLHMNDVKRQIAHDLGVPYTDLLSYSILYKTEARPCILDVEHQFYSRKAQEAFRQAIAGVFSWYHPQALNDHTSLLATIQCKRDYDAFMEQIDDIVCKYEKLSVYHTFTKRFVSTLKAGGNFFDGVLWTDVKDIRVHDLIKLSQKLHEGGIGMEELVHSGEACLDAIQVVVSEVPPMPSMFGGNHDALAVAEVLRRYPDPHPNMGEFLRCYLLTLDVDREDIDTVIARCNCWDDVKRVIEDSSIMSPCKQCVEAHTPDCDRRFGYAHALRHNRVRHGGSSITRYTRWDDPTFHVHFKRVYDRVTRNMGHYFACKRNMEMVHELTVALIYLACTKNQQSVTFFDLNNHLRSWVHQCSQRMHMESISIPRGGNVVTFRSVEVVKPIGHPGII